MHDLLLFHRVHGASIVLSEGGSVVTRKQSELGQGVAFSAKPLKIGQKVCVETTAGTQWSGALRVGVTVHDPAKITSIIGSDPKSATPLPRFVCPELTSQDGFWARAIREDYADTGNRITFYVNNAGQMHYFVNNEHKGLLLNCLPTNCNIWLLFDVYGNTTTLKFVPPAEAPVEIIAQGSSALRAYHTACESGTKAVFRSRLMLLGQDGGGKTSLKNALTGQRHNSEEVSTDGIDLSASCSFNLRNRSAWTLAVKGYGSRGDRGDAGDMQQKPSAASLEEEYQHALADNIVQQLLHQQKQKAESLSSKVSSSSVSSAMSITSVTSSSATGKRTSTTGCASSTTVPAALPSQNSKDKKRKDSTQASNKPSEPTSARSDHSSSKHHPATASTSSTAQGHMGQGHTGQGHTGQGHMGHGHTQGHTSQGHHTLAHSDNISGHKLLQEMPDRVVTLVQEMMEARGGAGGSAAGAAANRRPRSAPTVPPDSGRNIVLNIWDFSGQAVYYTTHQVFLSSRAVYVIVFDLQHDLYGQSQNAEGYSELTNLGYMDFWMHSIHAHASQNTRNSVDNVTLSPPIFIVGTHRASLAPDEETQHALAQEKFSQIEKFIRGKPYERHVVPTFYAVENAGTEGEDAEGDQQVVLLQRHIEEVASRESYMGEQMPIKWLKFELAIQELVEAGTHFSSLKQIQEVAAEHGVTTEEEFATVLAFYHDLGVIVHFSLMPYIDTPGGSTVILRPQWLVDMFRRVITAPEHRPNQEYNEQWHHLDSAGILEEVLLDHVWRDVFQQKVTLLGLMEKFDLLCPRYPNNASSAVGPSYFVPSCLKPQLTQAQPQYHFSPADVTFYINFAGFLPDGLYQRVVCRAIRWSQDAGGHEPHLSYRTSCFFLDSQHDFVLTMEPLSLARIKVTVMRMVNLETEDGSSSEDELIVSQPMPPPTPTACAKVRNFLESSLTELRELWMKRISYQTCIECHCDQPCGLHNQPQCSEPECIHFLNLDECIANKIVCCGHRRVRTNVYRKWFPAPALISKTGPIFSDSLILSVEDTYGNIEATKGPDLPSWVKGAAKLLNGGSIDDQDWITLAKKLGYKKNKIDKFNDDLNPALALIADWIVSSGNTSLSVDMLVMYIDQMGRDDIVDVIHRGQEGELDPPQVFISYQWDLQDEVKQLRDRMEKAGFTCWMDIGQMGGGDQLYSRIDEGIRNSKVVLACLSPKYIASHYCQRELALADLLRRHIIPIMYHAVPWPPPGGMALMLAQTLYVDMKGVGGHGGSGIHADIEDKHQEILQRLLCHVTPAAPPPPLPLTPAPALGVVSSPRTARTDMGGDSDRSSLGESGMLRPGDYTTTGDSDFSTDEPNNARTQHQPQQQQQRMQQHHLQQQQQQHPVEQVHVNKCAVCVIL